MTRVGSPLTTGVLASAVIAELRARAVDPGPILEQAGLAGVDPANVNAAPPAAQAMLAELAGEAVGDSVFGVRLAETVAPHDQGLLYFLVKAAPTVREAVSLFAQFLPAGNSGVELNVTAPAGAGAALDLRFLGVPRARLRHSVEYQLATVVRAFRAIAAGPVNPTRVTFAHRRLESVDVIERFFACPAYFGAESDQIVLADSVLDLPLIAHDPSLMQLLAGIAETIAARSPPSQPTFRTAVENALRRRLPTGDVKIGSIASTLGVAARTLSRRLEEEGTTLSDVLEELRTELALQRLSDGSFRERTIDQIALLLGYSDIATFSRAFRRWTGHPPSVVRDNPEIARRVVEANKRRGKPAGR